MSVWDVDALSKTEYAKLIFKAHDVSWSLTIDIPSSDTILHSIKRSDARRESCFITRNKMADETHILYVMLLAAHARIMRAAHVGSISRQM